MEMFNRVFFYIVCFGFAYVGMAVAVEAVHSIINLVKKAHHHFTKKTFTLTEDQLEEALKLIEEQHELGKGWDFIMETANLPRNTEASLNKITGVLSYWRK